MYVDRLGGVHVRPGGVVARSRVSVYGVCVEDSKFLLVKPAWVDVWEFPGGGVEEGESLIEALCREFLEETGFVVKEVEQEAFRVLDVKFFAEDLGEFFDSRMYFFRVRGLGSQDVSLIDRGEIAQCSFVPVQEVEEGVMNRVHARLLQLVRE